MNNMNENESSESRPPVNESQDSNSQQSAEDMLLQAGNAISSASMFLFCLHCAS